MFFAFAKVTDFPPAMDAPVRLYLDLNFLGLFKAYWPFGFATSGTQHLFFWHIVSDHVTNRQLLVLFATKSFGSLLLAALVWFSFACGRWLAYRRGAFLAGVSKDLLL